MEVHLHHIKPEVCHTRPTYREGKVPKAVKVYTCAQESKFLLVTNIPSIGAHNELVKLFSIYGTIEEHKILDEYPCEQFCETILVKYLKIEHARIAKIKLDDYNFYGGSLHVCYAPEFESIDDVRDKLNERKYIVSVKCKKYESIKFGTNEFESGLNIEKNDSYKKSFKNKTKTNKAAVKNDQKTKQEEKPNVKSEPQMVIFPQLPPGWKKETITGDASYDETAKEIRKKLEKTIPHQEQVYPKKRKKILQL